MENISDPRLVKRIAAETDAKIGGTVYSDALSDDKGPASTYIDMMQNNIREFSAALGELRAEFSDVMPGLVPGMHVWPQEQPWMAGKAGVSTPASPKTATEGRICPAMTRERTGESQRS